MTYTPTEAGSKSVYVACDNGAGTVASAFVTIKVVERPKVVVEVHGATPSGYGPVTGLKLVASSGSWKDSVNLGPAGTGSISLPSSLPASSEVCMSIKEVGGGLYKDSNACLTAGTALAGKTVFVLVPERWDIVSGTFAGESFPINLTRATAPSCDGLPFFTVLSNGAVTIKSELPVAFDRASSEVEITPADSVLWWSRINTIRDRVGMSWFKPAMMGEVTTTNGIRFIVNRETTGHNYIGLAGVGGSQSTGFQYGFVSYRNKEVLNSIPNLLIHEFIHVAGFGHTGPFDWLSVLHSFTCTNTSVTDHLTAEDVAYIQLWYKVKGITAEKGARFDFRAAIAGEKGEFYHPVGSGLMADGGLRVIVD